MKLCSKVVALVFLLTLTAAAQEPKQTSQPTARTIVLDIDIIDVNPEQRGEFEKIIRDKRAVERLISDGKARPIAGIQLRARSGQQATARMGQRVPVQASTTAQGTPQIQYENTGLSVTVEPRIAEGDRIEIKFNIDLTAVVRNDNVLAPTFVQRNVSDLVNVRPGEPALLVSVTQYEGLLPSLRTGSKPGDYGGGNFVIVLTARLVD